MKYLSITTLEIVLEISERKFCNSTNIIVVLYLYIIFHVKTLNGF